MNIELLHKFLPVRTLNGISLKNIILPVSIQLIYWKSLDAEEQTNWHTTNKVIPTWPCTLQTTQEIQ